MNGSRFLVEKITCTMSETRVWAMGVPFLVRPIQGRDGTTMAQTLVSLMVHVIFSTKNREPFITPEIEPELFAYMGGILKNNDSRLLNAGGTTNHVHLIVSQSKNVALSSLIKDVKKDSS